MTVPLRTTHPAAHPAARPGEVAHPTAVRHEGAALVDAASMRP